MPEGYYQTPAYVYRDSASFVVIYSVSDAKKPSMIGAHTYDGWMGESRIVDGTLVFVSTRNVGRNPVYTAVSDMVYKNTTKKVDVNQFQVKATDILPQWSTLKQTSVKLRNGKTKLSVQKSVLPVDCTQFLYRKQQKLSAAQGRMFPGESMTSIVSLPLTAGAKPTIKVVYGPSAGAVHVTKDSIYTVSSTYFPTQFACPALPHVSCMVWRGEGSYSTVYRFGIGDLGYKYASLVPGNVANQYSLDEDKAGYMRMVTSDRRNNKNTSNVYTLAKNGNIQGKLENIAPGEASYGVRFIGDYLYLVTFQQVDPLFVIDLSDAKKPAIKAELKMPGYSNYLHPYGELKDGVQYLIGLGYAVGTGSRGGQAQLGVKLDLYKVDFNAKDSKGKVAVSQVWSKIL
jgi:Beta propeller domain